MLIACPHCRARYQFPAEQLTQEELRAKCVGCGHVLRVTVQGITADLTCEDSMDRGPTQAGYVDVRRRARRPDTRSEASGDGESETATGSGRVDPDAPQNLVVDLITPPPIKTSGIVTLDDLPVVLPRDSTSDPSRATVASKRLEREMLSEPSIIIDMSAILLPDDDDEGAAPIDTPIPRSVIGFGELDRSFTPFSDDDLDLPTVPNARRRSVIFFVGGLCLLGIALVAVLQWTKVEPVAVVIEAPVVVPPIAMEPGGLKIEDLVLAPLPRRTSAALLTGRIVNSGRETQTRIALEVVLLQGEVPVKQRVVPCCPSLDAEQATAIALDPGHPHLAFNLNNLDAVEIAPGQGQVFAVVMTEIAPPLTVDRLVPRVTVKFSEAQRRP